MLRVRTSLESDKGCFRRSGPWGFKSGPDCGTVTDIRRPLRIQRIRTPDQPATTRPTCLLLKRAIANFAAADLDGLVRIVKRKLKKIQYWPHLINDCLAGTGLSLEPW
jgi:hypothetical protein